MIELVLLIAVVAVVILALRKKGGADEPAVVQRPGEYHITLAPQLDSSRSFLEVLAQRLAAGTHPAGDVPTRYFRVSRAGGQAEDFYLLAAAFRKGIFFIQAIMPRPLTRDAAGHVATLREFSEAVMLHYPPVPPVDEEGAEKIDAAVDEVARQTGNMAVKLVA